VDWPDKVWTRRYQSIVVSNEEMAQVERFRYLLSHGVKEGLVGRVTVFGESLRQYVQHPSGIRLH
jgi:hypothetical protein